MKSPPFVLRIVIRPPDVGEFEAVRRQGRRAIERWIAAQLNGTTVTVILIGWETAERDYVHYEIERSIERGNGLVPIYNRQLRNQNGETDWFRGENPLEEYDDDEGLSYFWRPTFADRYAAYDWVDDDGYHNLGDWVERAVRIARR